MFIEPDEFLIVMDMNVGGRIDLTFEEMCLLRTAGVRTLYYQAAIRWDVMQPEPGLPMDWSVVDRFVENGRAAGLKMLIPFLYSLPPWKPDEWFYNRAIQGQAYGVPVIDNDEVTGELDEFMAETVRRYGGDDVQVIYAIPANGEFAFDLESSIVMPYPMQMFTDWVVERQRPLVAQHGEVWTAYHPVSNPGYWKPVYGALFLKWNRQHINMTYFGGTEYVQGMRENVPKLVKGHMRMLVAPKHPWQPNRRIERWMLEEIQWALKQYQDERVMA
jgi:hypothetical protein